MADHTPFPREEGESPNDVPDFVPDDFGPLFVSLRDRIATGVPFSEDEVSDGFIDDAVRIVRTNTRAKNAHSANVHRWCAENPRQLAEAMSGVQPRPVKPDHQEHAAAQLDHWIADLFAEPALADAVCDLLPRAKVAAERAEYDKWLRPHPLEVDVPDHPWGWTCASCGSTHEPDEAHPAAVVGDREGHSELEYPIELCIDCIAKAYGQMIEKG